MMEPQQRSVSFNDAVVCIMSLHINDYTDDEVFDAWFTPQEYRRMNNEIKFTVAMIEKKCNFEEGFNFTARGLEHLTGDRMIHKAETRISARNAVLDEQDRQREENGVCNPLALRYAYNEYSFISHMTAFVIGAADEKAAIKGTQETANRPSSSSSLPLFSHPRRRSLFKR